MGALVDDVARYLGAIYRCQEGGNKVVDAINLGNNVYRWNDSATRAGSNWELNGATLVSALFPVPTDELKDNATDEEIRNYISNLSRKITMWPIDVEIKAELVSE